MNKEKNKELQIGYIENGAVIDHITHGKVYQIIKFLEIDEPGKKFSLGAGYESNKIGVKDILKIEGLVPSEYQLNLIALVSPDATVSLIKDGQKISKKKISIPRRLEGIILCPNNGCISNDSYQGVEPMINYNLKKGFKCHYCSNEFSSPELRFCE